MSATRPSIKFSIAYAALAVLGLCAPAGATDIWVSGTGSNGNLGTSASPYRTISHAMSVAVADDVIKVRSGTYDVAATESFPITIKAGVDIIGQESSTANYPRIGGDVNTANSSVAACFVVEATAATRASINIKYLRFVAESYTGRDAPSALFVKNGNYHDISDSFLDGCIIERLEMRDSANTDRAAVVFEAGKGSLEFEVKNCSIRASTLGGVDVQVGADADTPDATFIPITVRNTVIECRDTDLAEFGIRYAGSGERWAEFNTKTLGCTIDSTQCSSTSYGAATGLIMAAEPTGDAIMRFRVATVSTVNNLIQGNRSEGVLIRANSGTGSSSLAHIVMGEFTHNDIRDNGGAGVRIDWGTTGTARYINFSSLNNFIVDNLHGFYLENFADAGGATQAGFNKSSLDTVAGNTYEGYYTATTALNNLPSIVDCIVWGNNGGGAEHNFPSGWVASTRVSYSDFEGLSGGTGNLNQDPLFIDAANGNYHLDFTVPGISPCIDVGTGTPGGSFPSVDIDRQTREQDGDDNGSVIVDMGCDEVPDPSP